MKRELKIGDICKLKLNRENRFNHHLDGCIVKITCLSDYDIVEEKYGKHIGFDIIKGNTFINKIPHPVHISSGWCEVDATPIVLDSDLTNFLDI